MPRVVIDLTGDSDEDMPSHPPDFIPFKDVTSPALAALRRYKSAEEDDLDVTTLNYPSKEKLFCNIRKQLVRPIEEQFRGPRDFARELDKMNLDHEFTLSQYRRAYAYAVRTNESQIALNHLVQLHPELADPSVPENCVRMEELFQKSVDTVIKKAWLVNIPTKAHWIALQNSKVEHRKEKALRVGNARKAKKLEGQRSRWQLMYYGVDDGNTGRRRRRVPDSIISREQDEAKLYAASEN